MFIYSKRRVCFDFARRRCCYGLIIWCFCVLFDGLVNEVVCFNFFCFIVVGESDF